MSVHCPRHVRAGQLLRRCLGLGSGSATLCARGSWHGCLLRMHACLVLAMLSGWLAHTSTEVLEERLPDDAKGDAVA